VNSPEELIPNSEATKASNLDSLSYALLDDPTSTGFEFDSEDIAERLWQRLQLLPPPRHADIGIGERVYEEVLAALGARGVSRQRFAELPGAFCCGVYGDWGSGKTSLLRALERRFRDNGHVTVWFEPWRYEREEHLIIPLLVEVHAEVQREMTRRNLSQVKVDLVATGKRLLGRAARSLLRVGARLVEQHTGVDLERVGSDVLSAYGEQDKEQGWANSLSEVEEFKRDFLELVATAACLEHGAASPKQPKTLVLFVDDLDRCAPDQVRRLLESVKLFLNVPGVLFFLALDEEQVLLALSGPFSSHFSNHDNSFYLARARAKRYLGKFLQHRVYVGSGSQANRHVMQKLRDEAVKSICETSLVENDYDRQSYCQLIAAIKDNPRTLKRAVRWLYLEANGLHRNRFLAEFAEHILSSNWEDIWVEDLESEFPAAKRRVYRILGRMLDHVGIEGVDPSVEVSYLALDGSQFFKLLLVMRRLRLVSVLGRSAKQDEVRQGVADAERRVSETKKLVDELSEHSKVAEAAGSQASRPESSTVSPDTDVGPTGEELHTLASYPAIVRRLGRSLERGRREDLERLRTVVRFAAN
jgi:hypothetical protein